MQLYVMDPETLVGHLYRIESRLQQLEELCGGMIATLRANLERERITTSNDTQFRELLESWERTYLKKR